MGDNQEDLLPRSIRDSAAKGGHRVSIASSGKCDRISDMRPAYNEAGTTMQVARLLGRSGFVVSTSTVGALRIIPSLVHEHEQLLKTGLHQKVTRLLQEDASPGLSFPAVETLEAYLDCAGNSHMAAKQLSLHANTVNYRIRRIVQKTGLNLEDGVERLAIHLELKMRRFALRVAESKTPPQ